MSGHTPGPWNVDEKHAHPQALRVLAGRQVIADVNVYTFACGDNARLIAAAPELLALLKLLRDDWFEPHYGLNDIGYAALLRDRIRAAIAKAEGR